MPACKASILKTLTALTALALLAGCASMSPYSDLTKLGSVAAAREAGKYRLEGKDYVFADGDVALFRFNT